VLAPLTAILGWSHLLRMNKLREPEFAHALETIERNARSQSQLIDDLLDVSRIITGKLQIEPRPVDIRAVIEAAIDAVRPSFEAKNIQLETVMDQEGCSVPGDPNRLQQIFWNLFSNAVKFTPQEGQVRVRVKRSGQRVNISVSDSGIGISPEFLPYIFDRFRQAEGTASRQHGGLGLGLAIVRHLVELHGGTVYASSEGIGLGATFTATFPLIAVSRDGSDVEHAGNRSLDNSCLALKGMRVLVVDDQQDARDLVTIALTQGGAEVRASTTAREALEVLAQWKPDVLVADIGMPTEDGYELIKSVRALQPERAGTIPAVALTGYASDEDAARARVAGYQLHIPKPVSPSELVAKVANLIMKARHV